MFRSFFILLLTLMIVFTNGNNITLITNETSIIAITNETNITLITNETNITSPIEETTTIKTTMITTKKVIKKPFTVHMCGRALVQMLNMVCDRVKESISKTLLVTSTASSSHGKRHMPADDDLFARTILVKDSAQFSNTIIGDCCLKRCPLETLIKYCQR